MNINIFLKLIFENRYFVKIKTNTSIFYRYYTLINYITSDIKAGNKYKIIY